MMYCLYIARQAVHSTSIYMSRMLRTGLSVDLKMLVHWHRIAFTLISGTHMSLSACLLSANFLSATCLWSESTSTCNCQAKCWYHWLRHQTIMSVFQLAASFLGNPRYYVWQCLDRARRFLLTMLGDHTNCGLFSSCTQSQGEFWVIACNIIH